MVQTIGVGKFDHDSVPFLSLMIRIALQSIWITIGVFMDIATFFHEKNGIFLDLPKKVAGHPDPQKTGFHFPEKVI